VGCSIAAAALFAESIFVTRHVHTSKSLEIYLWGMESTPSFRDG
jgi:hypothetical protein